AGVAVSTGIGAAAMGSGAGGGGGGAGSGAGAGVGSGAGASVGSFETGIRIDEVATSPPEEVVVRREARRAAHIDFRSVALMVLSVFTHAPDFVTAHSEVLSAEVMVVCAVALVARMAPSAIAPLTMQAPVFQFAMGCLHSCEPMHPRGQLAGRAPAFRRSSQRNVSLRALAVKATCVPASRRSAGSTGRKVGLYASARSMRNACVTALSLSPFQSRDSAVQHASPAN
ncbi:MAG: hypothetical protein JWM95_1251, partial [Gemmatimonadetes bacterium]|nr:hypothetical protein [Gemmatimonadota bacterium]